MSNRSRRQFLEQSMWATAAAVAASSAGVLPGARAAEASKSPSERLGVAVVGVRGRGQSHINGFKGRDDVEIRYICDADAEFGNKRCEEIASWQDRRPEFVADIRKLLEDDAVDIVSIATPNHWHALGAIWAIQAGKDVYVEKPVSHNVAEGRRIVEAARKYNQICQCGTQCRSNPAVREAIDYIHAGKIGTVRVARGLCYKPRGSIGPREKYQVPGSVDYNLWLGPAPEEPVTRRQFHYDWHWQWPYGNGDLGNQGIHQMDIARWGLASDALCNGVISYGGRLGYEDAGDTANTQVSIFDYGDQSLVFEVRGLKTGDYRGAKVGVIFEGTDGYVVQSSYSSCTAFDADGNKVAEFKGGNDRNHFDNFLKAVRSRDHRELTGDIEEGHLSSALCHLGNISYRLGETIPTGELADRVRSLQTPEATTATLERTVEHLRENKVDLRRTPLTLGPNLAFNPKSEEFAGNGEANRLLTREYRAPFVVPAAGQV